MQLLIDSAVIKEVKQAYEWGWVKSATTNPSILAQSDLPPAKALTEMSKILPGQIYYQLTGTTLALMQQEAEMVYDILGEKLVLKIPATPLGFKASSLLSPKYPVAVTAIFSPSQAMVAHCTGAQYAVCYHNRAKRLLPNGLGDHLAADMVNILHNTETKVLAASLKSVEEIIEVSMAGVDVITVKFDVLSLMAQHDLSEQALADFNANGTGLLK